MREHLHALPKIQASERGLGSQEGLVDGTTIRPIADTALPDVHVSP